MSSKSEKDKAKQIQDKCQAVLNEMLRDEDNKYCVDCDSKGPRWASWNLGVFLCIRCAGIHRNLGVHISKVKSVNLDTWTPEQVVSLQQMGNSRARAVYEANLPDNFRRPQSDSSLESFVRAKYEHKKYIAREWVPPVIPKVDWEKEIDEEIERQKRKKKAAATADKKPIKISEVPQIPKPKNASPKPVRSTGPTQEKTTQDLLGLQNGEDGFTGFLSAPSKEEPKKEETLDAAKAEEESFFNQPAPTEKEKTKLTKDSILALYGSAPQTQPQMYNVPPTGYPQNYTFNTFPQQNFPVQNGMPGQFPPAGQFQQFPQNQFVNPMQGQFIMGNQPQTQSQFPNAGVATPAQFSGLVMSQTQFPATSQFPISSTQFPAASTQFPAGSTQFPVASTQFPQTSQFPPSQFATTAQTQFSVPAQTAFPASGPSSFGGVSNQPVSNPFFGTQSNSLPQQFAGMSLSQVPNAGKAAPTVSTNLWQ